MIVWCEVSNELPEEAVHVGAARWPADLVIARGGHDSALFRSLFAEGATWPDNPAVTWTFEQLHDGQALEWGWLARAHEMEAVTFRFTPAVSRVCPTSVSCRASMRSRGAALEGRRPVRVRPDVDPGRHSGPSGPGHTGDGIPEPQCRAEQLLRPGGGRPPRPPGRPVDLGRGHSARPAVGTHHCQLDRGRAARNRARARGASRQGRGVTGGLRSVAASSREYVNRPTRDELRAALGRRS